MPPIQYSFKCHDIQLAFCTLLRVGHKLFEQRGMGVFVTSFSSISYCSNIEYWSQKQAQSGNIHSIIFDHVGRQRAQHFPL